MDGDWILRICLFPDSTDFSPGRYFHYLQQHSITLSPAIRQVSNEAHHEHQHEQHR
jgi:hypothetical protein